MRKMCKIGIDFDLNCTNIRIFTHLKLCCANETHKLIFLLWRLKG